MRSSKGLFKTLFNLCIGYNNHPTEDYFSEVFAFCLRSYPEILPAILQKVNFPAEQGESYQVKAQQTFIRLPHHKCDSKPDICIYLGQLTIFIESKIDSIEGEDQLKRYADHLANLPGRGLLLYITKNYDPKPENTIVDKDRSTVAFRQLRWYEVYHVLKKFNDHLLIHETLQLMIDNGIAHSNRFNPADIIALSRFSTVKRIMDETMSGEVANKFTEVVGGINRDASSMTQLKDHDRYISYAYQTKDIWVGYGYWMNSADDSTNYPEVKFLVEVTPRAKNYEAIKKQMAIISAGDTEWNSYNLDIPKSWAGLYSGKSLREFMSEEDHVKVLKDFFLRKIDQFRLIKADLANLDRKA